MDREEAENFLSVAETSGVQRIIYLGGLGEMGPELSEHLKSRAEVVRILQSRRIQTTVPKGRE
jgi:prephenate dehydrogenase